MNKVQDIVNVSAAESFQEQEQKSELILDLRQIQKVQQQQQQLQQPQQQKPASGIIGEGGEFDTVSWTTYVQRSPLNMDTA